uniref:Peptidase A1 domain-containing protein n=1 Tax=Oryza punctata TaxID=4537 RepID=A0A0E0LAV4_ORYPU
MASYVSLCVLLCLLLLLAPRLGSSYRINTYTHDGWHYVIGSPADPRRPETTMTKKAWMVQWILDFDPEGSPLLNPPCQCQPCAGRRSSSRLPVLHRMSPCSPLGAARNHDKPSTTAPDGYVFRRDALRLHSLFRHDSTTTDYPAPAPSPSSDDLTIPATGNPLGSLPGAFEYHVVVGLGTPAQMLTVGFDTATQGATLLQCKPCASACGGQAFDPSLSSTAFSVPCGSPDCPFSSCSGAGCTVAVTKNGGALVGNATFVMDTFAFSPSAFVLDFRFACLEMGFTTVDHSSGILDLSRERHSLASRAPSSPDTVAFTYCLPSSKDSEGFLSIGATRPELSGKNASYATLRSSAAHPTRYVVKLAGIGLGGPDNLPIPAAALPGGECDSLLDLHATFTYLRPEIYAVLRDGFRSRMRSYRAAPPVGELDTCYDFTGLKFYLVPTVILKLDGGASLELSLDQMMYFEDQGNFFSVGCLAFAAAPPGATAVAVIGTLAQATTEVVYDVSGGKVGHIVLRSTRKPQPSPSKSSIPSDANTMPLVHRRGIRSAFGGARRDENGQPNADDVFDRDALRLRSLFALPKQLGGTEAEAGGGPAPTPAAAGGVTVTPMVAPISVAPGALEYRVLAGYGSPAQQFPVAFDTNFGVSVLRCKPCFAGAPCDLAFDPSRSSSFAAVPCGSPECAVECTGTSCPFTIQFGNVTVANGTLVRDTLTLSPSATFARFTFGCIEVGADADTFDGAVGLIDLSRSSHSLASRAISNGATTVAFSYCLPSSSSMSSRGFLSVGASRPEYTGGDIKYAPLSSNPNHPNSYFVELVGISVGGEVLPVPPAVFTAHGTLLETATEFTFLAPAAYAALRDEFRKEMAPYPAAQPFRVLDTCYNLTGLSSFAVPAVALKFAGGTELELDVQQMMYFTDPSNMFSVGCLAFAAAPLPAFPVSVIGTLAQTSTEVVYDVRGGRPLPPPSSFAFFFFFLTSAIHTTPAATLEGPRISLFAAPMTFHGPRHRKQSTTSSVDVSHRDGRRLRSLFAAVQSGSNAADAAAPAPAPVSSGVTIPATGTPTPVRGAPGFHDYTVVVSYGTPAQQLAMAFDTGLGISLVRCAACRPGAPCDDLAFDPSRSSTFAPVPCGSPDCRSGCSSGSTPACPLTFPFLSGAVVQDVLTLTPSASVDDFTFGCVEGSSGGPAITPPLGAAGLLDLSRDSRSLASRLAADAGGTFSYCLPLSTTSSHGFLAIGEADVPHNRSARVTAVAPLVYDPDFPNHYVIDLAGVSLGGRDLPIPPSAATASAAMNAMVLDTTLSYTYLKPSLYAVLRDAFRRDMARYPRAPAMGDLDTCYNFTGVQHEVVIPLVHLRFRGISGDGQVLGLGADQMFYMSQPGNFFSVTCLAFAALPSDGDDAPAPAPLAMVMGTLAQSSMEVVHDVPGGKIGFIPGCC